MKIETREDALLHCFDLWLWLAETGSRDKEDWPGWERNFGYLEGCSYDCPCCGYTEGDCLKCPIVWSGVDGGYGGYPCCQEGAEFDKWANANEEESKKWALEIAILALEAL